MPRLLRYCWSAFLFWVQRSASWSGTNRTISGVGRLSYASSVWSLQLVYLLLVAACASLLGQPVHRTHRPSWLLTLIFLGLGLSILTSQNQLSQIALLLLLSLTAVLLYRHHTQLWPISWWGIGAYGLAALCVVNSIVTGPPLSSITSLLACMILLPLVPFHEGYITALTRLPGNLP